MPVFKVGQPIETETPVVDVEMNRNRPLAPGSYVFTLQVVDDAGNVSPPAEATVIVQGEAPTARLKAPEAVPFGAAFQLDGSESAAAGQGAIKRFVWTLVRSP